MVRGAGPVARVPTMSQCKKFAPNIFNKTKCSNCFRQKEEHSAVALECNRASRTSARSGYLFLAPDWDFSVPLNRTKRWQRRWFVLYDDGELSYSVDEHPDTIPQGTVDMSQVLEVTSAEQLTGHPHSLALTGPDRVTFVKAASREDARWWLELLAVFPRRHKRNATFPGGRASPSLPHLGRSASPQPPRPLRHLTSGETGGGSPRTNFTTPPLKEERDRSAHSPANSLLISSSSNILNVTLTTSGSSSSVGSGTSPRCSLLGVVLKEDVGKLVGVDTVDHQQGIVRPQWVPESSAVISIDSGGAGARDALLANPRTEYLISSGSPPTRDKLRCEDKARARRDWRHARLRDIATALTDRSPESSLALPAEGLLHLKKGWLWHRDSAAADEWRRRWWVLCGPSLLGYRDQDEESGGAPLVSVELASVTGYSELRTDARFGFQVLWAGGPPLTLSAVTMGIRSNWLQALRKAAPGIVESPSATDAPPITTNTNSNSSAPSSTSSSRHSTASSGQLTAVITAQHTPTAHGSNIRLRGDMSISMPCRLSTSSSGGNITPTTPKSGVMFSSDEEYRTASEGGRRDSMTDVDWIEGVAGNTVKTLMNRCTEQRIQRSRPQRLPRAISSRPSTLDGNFSSPDELDAILAPGTVDTTSPTRPHHRYSVPDGRAARKLHPDDDVGEDRRRKRPDAQVALDVARAEALRLRALLGEAASKELKSRDALYELEKIERDLTLKLEKLMREQKSLSRRLAESDEALRESDERGATWNRELQAKHRIVASLQDELTCANERCAASRLENDRLYKKLQELKAAHPHPPSPTPTTTTTTIAHLINIDLDAPLTALSAAELTRHCLDLRTRFERAVAEIRALQQRLREAHAHVDALQLDRLRYGRCVDAARAEYEGRLAMLTARIDDLTAKLLLERGKGRSGGAGAAKVQTVAKVGRRSLSLKGRESFSLNKEVEDKVTLLEAKLLSLENPSGLERCRSNSRRVRYSSSCSGRRSTDNGSPIDDRSLRRLRRKSLDGATASEPMKLLRRLNALEEKVGGVCATSVESLNALGAADGGATIDSELDTLSMARDKYRECVGALGTWPIDLGGRMRELGGILRVPGDLVVLDGDTEVAMSAAQSLVDQLERALRRKYTELHERRRGLRERGELDQRAKMQLMAEKIAFEDVIIDRIIQTTNKHPTTFLTRETTDTHHLLHQLHLKLTLPHAQTPPTHLHTSIHHLTQLFTRHLLANATISPQTTTTIDGATWQSLLDKQMRAHQMLLRYEQVKLAQLVDRLVDDTDTLARDDSCMVGARVWDEARRNVSAELIQTEVRHVLMKAAQRYEGINAEDYAAGYSFSVCAVQRYQIEQWTDAIEQHLVTRIDKFIANLTAAYKTHLARAHLSKPAVPNSSAPLLQEYADIIAHVALVDARIDTLRTYTVNSTLSDTNSAVSGDHPTVSDINSTVSDVNSTVSDVNSTVSDVNSVVSVRDSFVFGGGGDASADLRTVLGWGDVSSIAGDGDVSVAEFKTALKVAVLCADRCVNSDGGGVAVEMSSSAKCRGIAIGGCDVYNNGGFQWIGADFNSCDDSISDATSSHTPTSPTTTYHHQIALLRDAFQQTLATYAADNRPAAARHLVESGVERLRAVCERVLVAMERVHRAAVQRIRAAHNADMAAVRADKEQALAEETHATLAALDAMRKAHEAEVVKEVARYKQELSRQQAAELLELRERLSVKCLEAAALQEQLGSATRQLAHAHQHILHMEQQRAPPAERATTLSSWYYSAPGIALSMIY